MRSRFAALLAATLPAAFAFLPLQAATAAGAPTPRLVVRADQIEAGEDMTLSVFLLVQNPTAMGLYTDSLECDVESLDPGETRESRTSRISLPGVARLVASLSAGDTTQFQYQMRTGAEHARLTFRLFVHQSGGPAFALTDTAEALPGPTSARFPSQFTRVGGRRVEYLLVPADTGAAPGLLLIHGHGSNARLMLARAIQISRRGYTVMAASMPGYGLSEGPADFGGPATLAAMGAALDALKRAPGVDSARIAVWGVSRGAAVAAGLAAKRGDFRCAVAQSGIYDLWAVYRGTTLAGLRETIVAEAGRDSAAWRARSPALAAAKIRTPLLILHGERDSRVPVSQARGYYETLVAGGSGAEARFIEDAEHSLSDPQVDRATLGFLARKLRP